MLFTSAKPPAEAAQVSFVAALAVADLADRFVPPALVSLKWPNDLLIGGRKASGILVESGSHPNGLWLAVGIGMNLASAPTDIPTTSFAEHMIAPPPKPLEALTILAEAFECWRLLWDSAGFSAIADAWTARAHGLGQACTARLGSETVEGVAEGLDPDGSLRLRLSDGSLRRITAGDVFFGDA